MSCSIFGDAFLLLSLGNLAIMRFFIVLGIVVALYVVYGVHGATRHDAQLADYVAARYMQALSDVTLRRVQQNLVASLGYLGTPALPYLETLAKCMPRYKRSSL